MGKTDQSVMRGLKKAMLRCVNQLCIVMHSDAIAATDARFSSSVDSVSPLSGHHDGPSIQWRAELRHRLLLSR
jgi:hypothetical protein